MTPTAILWASILGVTGASPQATGAPAGAFDQAGLGLYNAFEWMLPRRKLSTYILNDVSTEQYPAYQPELLNGTCPKRDCALKSWNAMRLNENFKITNKRADYVNLYWVSFTGVEVFHGTLQTDETFEERTYVTHPWRVYTADGHTGKLLYQGMISTTDRVHWIIKGCNSSGVVISRRGCPNGQSDCCEFEECNDDGECEWKEWSALTVSFWSNLTGIFSLSISGLGTLFMIVCWCTCLCNRKCPLHKFLMRRNQKRKDKLAERAEKRRAVMEAQGLVPQS